MRRITLALAVLLVLASPAFAPTEVQVMGFNVSGNDIITTLQINRGIDSGARRGAPFRLQVSLTWPGLASPVEIDVPIRNTTFLREVDPHTVEIQTRISVDRPPASASDIIATAKIVGAESGHLIKD